MSDPNKRLDRSEIPKHVEKAEKLLQKGKPADALDEYLLVLAADPTNDTVRQMAADICLSLQRVSDAANLLSELFQRQTDVGDATRASLTYKKLARFAKPTWEQRFRFGQLLENSNPKLAVETYEEAYQELSKAGRKSEAMAVLDRTVALEPSQSNLLRLAQLSSETEDHKRAAAAYMKVAELAENAGSGMKEWVEKAYAEDAADPKIAMAYGKNLLQQDQVGAAIFVLEPLANVPNAPPEFREAFAKALLAANRLTEAVPIVWRLFELDPSSTKNVANLIGALMDAEQDAEAVGLARRLEEYQNKKGERRSFLTMMQELTASHRPSAEILEFMSELYNASNREGDYFQTLLKLFDLHCSLDEYDKAAEALDRAADIDAYEPGHQKRLEMVHGKIDENRYKAIAARFDSLASSTGATRSEEKILGAGTLQDLMLQAEILVQYGMRSKAIERLQRIQELFPHEQERNQDLQQLYLAAGLTPTTTSPAPPSPSPIAIQPAPPPAPAVVKQSAPSSAVDSAGVNNFARVPEITRKLYRQNNADAVLSIAVNEIGEQWKVDRCIGVMRKPGLTATMVKEHCSEGMAAGNLGSLERVAALAQDLAASKGTLIVRDIKSAPELEPVRQSLLELGTGSLLAIAICDGTDHVGVLVLMSSRTQTWSEGDILILKTIGEQIVIALNNAGLRRLVKNLSVTDEKSGLLEARFLS